MDSDTATAVGTLIMLGIVIIAAFAWKCKVQKRANKYIPYKGD